MNTPPPARRLVRWVEKFIDVPILVVGDLMIDRAWRGSVDRISPEAPVPVIDVQSQTQSPGGAGNVAGNLAALGAAPTLVSVRGNDEAGSQISMELRESRVRVDGLVVDPSRPTTVKTRVIAGHQQVTRLDFEKRGPLSSAVLSGIIDRLKTLIPRHRAVILSDYGKGVVTAPVIKAALRQAHRHGAPVIVDPKIEHFLSYKGVDCITPNTKEAVEGMRSLPPKSDPELVDLGWRIMRKLKSKSLLITRGEKGMFLFKNDGSFRSIATRAREVFDVTGAGDTVIATFTLARAVGAPYEDAAHLANLAASLVVAKVGTAVATRAELLKLLRNSR